MKDLNSIIDIIKKEVIDRTILEDKLNDIIDSENISIIQFSKICEELSIRGITIIESNSNNQETKKENLLAIRKNNYLKMQNDLLNEDGDKIIIEFFKDYTSARCQYSYIPVTLLGMLAKTNEYGIVSMEDLIDFFIDFYEIRRWKKQIVEKPASIFANDRASRKEIKRLILFNPLGRSFLIKYIRYEKTSDILIFNENMWKKLTVSDFLKVKKKSEEILRDYYQKI